MRATLFALALSCLVFACALASERSAAGPEAASEPSFTAPASHEPTPYLIVTTRALRPEFLRLANVHTRTGLRATVWTLESIRAAFPDGRDDAERIRLFLQQAYRDRGARWLLIGGSHAVIPMRRATIAWPLAPPGNTHQLATDQYYACLDGSWNADGDSLWGEDSGDDVDWVPELVVGRAPVATRAEAARFVERTIEALDRPPGDARGPDCRAAGATVLLLASELAGGIVDGARSTEPLRPFYESTASTRVTRLYENAAAWPGSLPLTRESAIESLNQGDDLNVLVGPGGPGIFATHDDPSGTVGLTQSDFASLTNCNRGIFYFLSAFTCRPDTLPSLGEALMNAPGGGATAVLGCSDLQFIGLSTLVMRQVLTSGAATIGEAQFDMLQHAPPFGRESTQGLVLLGDPALPMRVPAPVLAAIAIAPGEPDVDALTSIGARDAGTTAASVAGRAATSRGPAVPITLAMRLDSPSPARTSMRVVLSIPQALDGAPIEISAYDIVGRRVRALERDTARAGRHAVDWNLDDDSGLPVRTGVYFIGARVGAHTVPQRVIVVR